MGTARLPGLVLEVYFGLVGHECAALQKTGSSGLGLRADMDGSG